MESVHGAYSGFLKPCSAWLEGNPGRVAASWPLGDPASQAGLKQEESGRDLPVQCIERAVRLQLMRLAACAGEMHWTSLAS